MVDARAAVQADRDRRYPATRCGRHLTRRRTTHRTRTGIEPATVLAVLTRLTHNSGTIALERPLNRSQTPEVVVLSVLPAPIAQSASADAAWTPPAWEDIVREHGDRVYRLAYRLSGNAHDAEDITQETFIRVFRSLDSYRPGSFEGWLHRITTNVFLDLVRRRQRIRMEALPEETDRIAGREPSPEQAWSDANLDPDLQASLDELLPEFRAAVVLCDVEGLSYEEIGATLGVKLGTVRSRIHRGRQALRAGLERRRAAAAVLAQNQNQNQFERPVRAAASGMEAMS